LLLGEHLLHSQEGLCTRELTVFLEPNVLSTTFSLQLPKCKQSQKVFPKAMCYHKRDTSGNFLWTSVFFLVPPQLLINWLISIIQYKDLLIWFAMTKVIETRHYLCPLNLNG